MWRRNCRNTGIALGFWVSVGFLTGSIASASQQYPVSPPYNITMKMDMFTLQWEWSPHVNRSCDMQYTKYVSPGTSMPVQSNRNSLPSYTLDAADVDLNGFINFKVEARCRNQTQVDVANMSVEVLSGNPETAVREFHCIWYNLEYINCTWLPGTKAPPKANYSLFYWLKSQRSDTVLKPVHPMIFEEFLDTGRVCHHYNYKDGTPIGCHFEYHQSYESTLEGIQMVVTDRSQKHIRPFIYYVEVGNILVFTPTITDISRTKNALRVTWNVSKGETQSLQFEVSITNVNNGKFQVSTVRDIYTKEFVSIDDYAVYTVKVRGTIYDGMGIWSEWSEKTSTGKTSIWTTSFTLLILIPIIMVVLAIILVLSMKRLIYIICPPIPDPGKVFKKSFGDPNTFQHFIKHKYGKVNVWNMPQKEEVCSVILVEPTTCVSQAE